jgi:methylenetetrahydrofolate reductase (NADPH)
MSQQNGQSAPCSEWAHILDGYSVEVTTRDARSLSQVQPILPSGTEVFIAALPKEKPARQVEMAVELRALGHVPVPHIVARHISDVADLDALLARLVREAGVDRALVLGGDRDTPAGAFDSALKLIETGLFERHGIRRLSISAYPEGHPRISDGELDRARTDKLLQAEARGLSMDLVSQFCFDAAPIVAFAERLQSEGCKARLRVGIAGPADRATLIKYAMICGVGPSLRALKERQALTRSLLSGETPERLLSELSEARRQKPDLPISGIHFFTFSSLAESVTWAADCLKRSRAA